MKSLHIHFSSNNIRLILFLNDSVMTADERTNAAKCLKK